MFERLWKKGWALAVSALMVASIGFATTALAEGEPTYKPDEAMLTKVIVAPIDTDASGDSYVFHFAGAGTVEEIEDDSVSGGDTLDILVSDGVKQDDATLKTGDIVPTIPDVTLKGVALTSDNSLSDGKKAQRVVQVSIDEILEGVVFPHAGVYTYVVTEKSATTVLSDGAYINASQAKYTLRIRVENTNVGDASVLGDRALKVAEVTVEQTKDDNGNDKTEKVDPTYPKATAGKITSTADGKSPGENELATDDGLNVPGFTFGNEYIKGGSFVVKKLYDGEHSDRTKYSTVELAIYSEVAESEKMHGSVLTYVIEGEGIDVSEGSQDGDGEHMKLNGVYDIPQANHYMQKFNDKGWAFIKADLKEDSVIRVTGMFGPYDPSYEDEAPNGKDRRMTISTSGLTSGQHYWVIERNPGDYRPTGYVYEGEDVADPRESADGMTATRWLNSEITDPTDFLPSEYENNPDSYITRTLEEFALCLDGTTTGSATTVFVVNTIDENKVSPTGILINNLPYILMVGGPLAIFAIMFVNKRRRNAAA